ncbi:ATP-binding protein [Streptomyces sp. NPDC057575]|uniref:ATP-binding protein n=1 Tax=unclassified Streptomyces TaxID=2593676 RepID=UPI0036A76824
MPGTIDEAGQAAVEPARQDDPDSPDAAGTSPFTDGVRLYVPGAHVVSTKQLGAVTEAIAHTIAAHGVVCVYGETGHGKTVAVHQALRLLPRRIPVHHARVAVKPALPQLRAALLTAFGLPATALMNRTDAADRALLEAFQAPGVLVIDDVQRIAAPELDYLRLLADAPTTQTSLVLCSAGAECTLARAPALASRVLTWQHVPRLEPAQVPGVLRLFHPLWDTATDTDLLHTDETRAHATSVPGRRSPPTRTSPWTATPSTQSMPPFWPRPAPDSARAPDPTPDSHVGGDHDRARRHRVHSAVPPAVCTSVAGRRHRDGGGCDATVRTALSPCVSWRRHPSRETPLHA